MKKKVLVMAVNNPASNDNRVKKTAEALLEHNFEVIVFGVKKDGFKNNETINGVKYVRLELDLSLQSIIAAISPNFFVLINPFISDRKIKEVSKNNVRTFLSFIIRLFLLPFFIIGKFLYNFRRLFKINPFLNYPFFIIEKITKKILFILIRHPSKTSLGAKILFGSYLSTFYVSLLKTNADIYYSHELWLLESCSLVSTRLKKKLVYDSHELEPYRNIQWNETANKIRFHKEELYIKKTNQIITVSEGCANELKKYYNLEKEIIVIKNTPCYEKMTDVRYKVREKIITKIKKNDKILIYTGLATFNRGIDFVLDAIKDLKNYHLVTVGSWDENYKNYVNSKVLQNNLSKNFHILPQVEPECLVNFISNADIAVIPIVDTCLSYKYCLPNKLFEAAFAGLPILASDLPDMRNFIFKNGSGKTFTVGNVESFKKQLFSLSDYKIKDDQIKKMINSYSFEKEILKLINKLS